MSSPVSNKRAFLLFYVNLVTGEERLKIPGIFLAPAAAVTSVGRQEFPSDRTGLCM